MKLLLEILSHERAATAFAVLLLLALLLAPGCGPDAPAQPAQLPASGWDLAPALQRDDYIMQRLKDLEVRVAAIEAGR